MEQKAGTLEELKKKQKKQKGLSQWSREYKP